MHACGAMWESQGCKRIFQSAILYSHVATLQGSHWSRSQRQFVTHDARPHPLTTRVRPSDVPQFASADYGSRFALYSDRQQRLCTLGLHESLAVALARGESDLVTIVPLTRVKGLSVAAIGEPLFRPVLLQGGCP